MAGAQANGVAQQPGPLTIGADSGVLDAIQNAIIVTDTDGRIVFWNRFAEQLYGWSRKEVLGRDVNEVIPTDPAAARAAMDSIIDGETWSDEFPVRRKNGETFPAFVTTSAIRDVEGRIKGLVGVSFDSTPQKNRDQRHETLFNTMSEGFALCEAIWSRDGRLIDYTVVEMNLALMRMLDVGPEAVGTRLSAAGSGADRTAWLALCERVLRTGGASSFENHDVATDRWHEIRVTRVSESRMGQLFFDITERKRVEVRQAELFDELNHRVKNNLMLVSSILQMKARGTDNDVVRDQLLRAVARVEGIAQVHTALYKGSRKDAIDFGAYLKELCAGLSRSLVHEERLSLEVEAESIMVRVDDAIPLGMVVNELITNALKYAYPPPGAGSISVRFRREEDGLLLVVSDQGCGLPAAGDYPAGGLGMKLVATLIAQVKGRLSIAGHAGTTFEVRLPLELAAVPGGPLPN